MNNVIMREENYTVFQKKTCDHIFDDMLLLVLERTKIWAYYSYLWVTE